MAVRSQGGAECGWVSQHDERFNSATGRSAKATLSRSLCNSINKIRCLGDYKLRQHSGAVISCSLIIATGCLLLQRESAKSSTPSIHPFSKPTLFWPHLSFLCFFKSIFPLENHSYCLCDIKCSQNIHLSILFDHSLCTWCCHSLSKLSSGKGGCTHSTSDQFNTHAGPWRHRGNIQTERRKASAQGTSCPELTLRPCCGLAKPVISKLAGKSSAGKVIWNCQNLVFIFPPNFPSMWQPLWGNYFEWNQ